MLDTHTPSPIRRRCPCNFAPHPPSPLYRLSTRRYICTWQCAADGTSVCVWRVARPRRKEQRKDQKEDKRIPFLSLHGGRNNTNSNKLPPPLLQLLFSLAVACYCYYTRFALPSPPLCPTRHRTSNCAGLASTLPPSSARPYCALFDNNKLRLNFSTLSLDFLPSSLAPTSGFLLTHHRRLSLVFF